MQIILTEDVPHLGKVGDVVNVKDGYGRNFLIPQQKAIPATANNMARVEHEKRVIAKRLEKLQAQARTQVQRIEAVSATVRKPVGEEDRLFGSVTSRDVEKAMREEGLTDIDRKAIQLPDPLKTLGVYKVPVKLAPGVYAKLMVWVLPE
jgi:large subunit ribosomal protein L9